MCYKYLHLKHLFVHDENRLTLDDMRSLFKVNFSEKGNNYRPVEEAAYIFFIDFMEECAGNRVHKDFTFKKKTLL